MANPIFESKRYRRDLAEARALEELLRLRFPDRERASVIASGAGLDVTEISIAGAPLAFWANILDFAARLREIEKLLDSVELSLRPAPKDADVRKAIQRVRAVTPAEGSPSPLRGHDDASTTLESPDVNMDEFEFSTEILPPCDWCWWRELGKQGLKALSQGLCQYQDKFVKRGGVRLTDALPSRLSKYTNADCSREIVEAANMLLISAYGEKSKTKLIAVDFDGKKLDNDWAGALSIARQQGPQSLVALFLAIFLLQRRLKSLADANLQRLHKAS